MDFIFDDDDGDDSVSDLLDNLPNTEQNDDDDDGEHGLTLEPWNSLNTPERDGEHGLTLEPWNSLSSPERFTILSEFDIKKLQEDAVNKVSSVLCVSNASACILLYHNRWNVTRVLESWVEDEEKALKTVGLFNQPQVKFNGSKDSCEVCLQSSDKIMSAGCAHPVCSDCWMKYIDTNIDECLSKCLTLRCPNLSCDAAVDGDMIRELANESSKVKYDHFLFWSYVEMKKMKWCPAPGCDYVACYEGGDRATNFDVTCLCYHSFCWKCGKASHSPVDCETADQWMEKVIESASENGKWILAHTKPCPQCKRPIEKNQDYINHIICNCNFQFCWVCLREWSKCDRKSCSSFIGIHMMEFQYMDGEEVETNMEIDFSKRNTHYYEGWARNDFLRKSVLQKLIDLSSMDRNTLRKSLQKLEAYFVFIRKAWQQIAECRRMLQWTNVYGYFLPENEKAKKKFCEYIQVEAEVALEKLQQCAKVDHTMFQNDYPEASRDKFRKKVVYLTTVTKIYFENLIRAIEDGLDEVEATRSINVTKIYFESLMKAFEDGLD